MCMVGMTVAAIERRLDMTHSILTYFYGPSYTEYLRSCKNHEYEWKRVSLILHKWIELAGDEQGFLVEVSHLTSGNCELPQMSIRSYTTLNVHSFVFDTYYILLIQFCILRVFLW